MENRRLEEAIDYWIGREHTFVSIQDLREFIRRERWGDGRKFWLRHKEDCKTVRLPDWQPISTAPKDGTRILLWPCTIKLWCKKDKRWRSEQQSFTGEWDSRAWVVSPNEATEYLPDEQHPTLWASLPTPPVVS